MIPVARMSPVAWLSAVFVGGSVIKLRIRVMRKGCAKLKPIKNNRGIIIANSGRMNALFAAKTRLNRLSGFAEQSYQ